MSESKLVPASWTTLDNHVINFTIVEHGRKEIAELNAAIDLVMARPDKGSARFGVVAEFTDVAYFVCLSSSFGAEGDWFKHVIADVCQVLETDIAELFVHAQAIMQVKEFTHGTITAKRIAAHALSKASRK